MHYLGEDTWDKVLAMLELDDGAAQMGQGDSIQFMRTSLGLLCLEQRWLPSLDNNTKFVYTNVSLTADEASIRQTHRRSVEENTTLNELFRGWIAQYVQQPADSDRFAGVMAQLRHVQTGVAFTREEVHERR